MKVTLITGSNSTALALKEQLWYFLNRNVIIESKIVDEGFDYVKESDLVVYSSQALYNEVLALDKVCPNLPYVIGQRNIDYAHLEKLFDVKEGTRVLLVNDTEGSARETLQSLKDIGLDHMLVTIYYPNLDIDTSLYEYALTPGELEYVPLGVQKVIDIGARVFSFHTIARILLALGLLDNFSKPFSRFYLKRIMKILKPLTKSRDQLIDMNQYLSRVIESLDTGLVVYDTSNRVVSMNDTLKIILKTSKFHHEGKTLQNLFYGKPVLEFLISPLTNDSLSTSIELDNISYDVERFKLPGIDYYCATFKSHDITPSSKANYDKILQKGYIAKHSIGDIIGESSEIIMIKEIIAKLAPTQMSILIQGDSGTGKELVASSIHRLSSRCNNPFIGVNFCALPDELIESELFGYVEGAFTGARKGGKRGLFDEANGGTLFLDEIGDISLKMQAKLLRVLEEQEFMPIGGTEIKSVDVRIIAATNKNLKSLVENKEFREDLYYRIRMGSVFLPSLKQRLSDIPLLIEHFIRQLSCEEITCSKALLSTLENLEWKGNIRELRNTVIYMIGVRRGNILDVSDMPWDYFSEKSSSSKSQNEPNLTVDQIQILREIDIMANNGIAINRASISKNSPGKKWTEAQTRRLLCELRDLELISIRKGRNGISMTRKGLNLLRHYPL